LIENDLSKSLKQFINQNHLNLINNIFLPFNSIKLVSCDVIEGGDAYGLLV